MGMEKFKAPALPFPPITYDPRHLTDLIRVLRLYFERLDSNTPCQADSYRANDFYGGRFFGDGFGVRFPHIAASDSTSQYATGNNTPTIVKWNTLEAGYGWTLNSPGSATADYGGVYKITYSLEFANTANDVHDVVIWLRVNGNDVPNSATYFSIRQRKSVGVPTYLCAYSEVTFPLNAGEEVELVWATDLAYVVAPATDGVYMRAIAAQTAPPATYAHPAVPSAVGSITFLSALP